MGLTIKTAEDLHAEAVARAKASLTTAIDAHVEARAKALGYNSAAHIAGYRDSTVEEWAAEAQTFIGWRDAVWLAAFDMLAQAEASGEVPGAMDVIGALPEWPGAS